MKLEKAELELLTKKLEYRFKNSGNALIEKLNKGEELSDEDVTLLLNKLEYRFKKSGNALVEKLQSSKVIV